MDGKRTIMIFLSVTFLISCMGLNSQSNSIVNIINKKGINEKHQLQLPIWAKYTKSVRSGDQRAFMIYADGQIYNFSSSDESDSESWNNWGIMPSEYLDLILNTTHSFEGLINSNDERSLGDATVLIEYRKDGVNRSAIISKSYDTETGTILKKINDLVNEGLASRNKKK